MRKVMLLAALLAMVLAAAAPAFAQTATAGSVQYVDCDQIQAAIGQYQKANSEDFSAVAQRLGVSQNQVLACFGSAAAGHNINVNTASAATSTATASASAAAASPTATAPAGGKTKIGPARVHGRRVHGRSAVLPVTGGASLFALGAGALLVAGGLVARRTFR